MLNKEAAKQDGQREEKRAFTVADACHVLSVSRSHLYVLASRGQLRMIRLGARTLVPRAEIDRLLGVGEAA